MKDLPLDSMLALLTRECGNFVGVYLYGSSARGDQRQESDIDLAILPQEPLSAERIIDLTAKLSVLAKKDIDLVDLLQAPTVLQFQIVSTGKRIYGAPQMECEQFEDYVYHAYAKFNEERSGILSDIRKRGTIF